MPSPPQSPPLAAYASANDHALPRSPSGSSVAARRRGAAHTVAEECERLFCGTLRAVFLGEGNLALQDPLAAGAHHAQRNGAGGAAKVGLGGLITPSQSPEAMQMREDRKACGQAHWVEQWVEVFDYVGDAKFRGFVASNGRERTLFVFFDDGAIGKDLKPGLMALLELCEVPQVDCSRVVACLDRHAHPEDVTALSRDLGWVGFEPYTLVDWTRSDDIISESWLFLSMDV